MNLFLLIFILILTILVQFKQRQKRLSYTLQAARQGDPQAQYEAALLYYHGKGVPKDWQQSFDYLTSAAQTGHVRALNTLGALYCAGHGTEKNLARALACYQRAAEQGDFEGMVNTAVLYRMVQKDDAQAFAWMKKAADGGSPLGQRMLAEFYYAGIGTEIDKQTGLKYYALAAQQAEPIAVAFLKTRDPRLQHQAPM